MVRLYNGGSSFLASVAVVTFCSLWSGDDVRRRERAELFFSKLEMVAPHIAHVRGLWPAFLTGLSRPD